MIEEIADSTVKMGGAVGAFIAAAFAFRRYMRADKMETAQATKVESAAEAESSVIKTLREEVERLANTNRQMSLALTDLQLEIINLRNENITFVGEIGALRNENARLTSEILRLREQINLWPVKCEDCPYKKGTP